MDQNTLQDMVFAAFGESRWQPGQATHIYKNIEDDRWRLIAIYLTARNVNIFSEFGDPITISGPIQKENYGRFIFADDIYFKGMNKMHSSSGMGYEGSEYIAYIFTYISVTHKGQQNKVIRHAASQLKSAGYEVEEKDDPVNPGDNILTVYLGHSFESVLEFDEQFIEGKLI